MTKRADARYESGATITLFVVLRKHKKAFFYRYFSGIANQQKTGTEVPALTCLAESNSAYESV
jgi:hypothetical protein